MTFALLRRARVPLVPQRLTVSPRVPLLKISTFDKQRRGAKKYVRVGIKRGRQWRLVSFDVPPWEEKQGEGEKRMGRLYRVNTGDKKQLGRGHLSNVYRDGWIWGRNALVDAGLWIITSTLSWTVMQLAASFWRISVTPLESLSYFSLGSSSLSSSWLRKETCKMCSHFNVFLKRHSLQQHSVLSQTSLFKSHWQNPSCSKPKYTKCQLEGI